MNTLAYIIYLVITVGITVKVGGKLHKHGYWFILDLFANNQAITTSVNKLLLIGYYLLNIGYVAITINNWQSIATPVQLVEIITTKVGIIIIGLAIIHYFNMLVLYLAAAYQRKHI
jgi:hypothetical protein